MDLSYEYLKSLPKNKEYRFKLFDIIGSVYCALTYNEDFNHKICVDLFDHGFTGQVWYYNNKSKYQEGTFYNLNKNNFNALMRLSQYIKQDIINNLNNTEIEDEEI